MKITKKIAEDVYHKAVQDKLCEDKKAVIFYLKEVLDNRLNILKSCFPKNALHAVAIKTCNHPKVLEHIVNFGFGLEAASFEEVLQAKKVGAENNKIVFDSPAKTREEITLCHLNFPGIHTNANSIEELTRYPDNFNGTIGLRINPLVDNQGGEFFNVSTSNSKFGIPINKEAIIIESCVKYSMVNCLHIHIGSNLKDFSANIKAIDLVVKLADKINKHRTLSGCQKMIETIDIGGGLDFDSDDTKKSVKQFVKSISEIPRLMENYKIITEYGTFIHKSNSFLVSNIEYVIKNQDDLPELLFLHVGADLFVRKVYSDMNLNYPYSVLNNKKKTKTVLKNYDVVGPLCFAGDILFKNIQLNEVHEGDKFFIFNIGANTISMWSAHCSRTQPDFLFV